MLTKAYLNWGRWLVDCPGCNTGWLVAPETPFSIYDAKGMLFTQCFCGWKPEAVQFPDELDKINQLMVERPNSARNWRPGETIVDLRIENAVHGVSSGLD